jgi:hypothetical protein
LSFRIRSYYYTCWNNITKYRNRIVLSSRSTGSFRQKKHRDNFRSEYCFSDLPGKMRESHRILQENTWNMEAVFRSGIFRWFPYASCRKALEVVEIPDRNTTSNFLVFSVASPQFPAVHLSTESCSVFSNTLSVIFLKQNYNLISLWIILFFV